MVRAEGFEPTLSNYSPRFRRPNRYARKGNKEMKICANCSIELTDLNSYIKSKERKQFQSYCKPCLLDKQKNRWINRKLWAIELKGGKCFDCKNIYPHFVYDFHHLDPKIKKFTWNKMRLLTKSKILEELEKCILICSNCHRIRHYSSNDYSKNSHLERVNKEKKHCSICSNLADGNFCSKCYRPKTKIIWPDVEFIKEKLKSQSMLSLARELGVSDNGIRKHLKKQGF